jgi:hypothetical protein
LNRDDTLAQKVTGVEREWIKLVRDKVGINKMSEVDKMMVYENSPFRSMDI